MKTSNKGTKQNNVTAEEEYIQQLERPHGRCMARKVNINIKDPRRVHRTIQEQKYSKERYKSNIDVPTSGSKYRTDIVQPSV